MERHLGPMSPALHEEAPRRPTSGGECRHNLYAWGLRKGGVSAVGHHFRGGTTVSPVGGATLCLPRPGSCKPGISQASNVGLGIPIAPHVSNGTASLPPSSPVLSGM